MVHAQDSHVGAAAGAALGDLAEGVVIDAQEADRTGGLPGGGLDVGALGAQAGEGETVAAAGLLDEGGVAQGLEDAGGIATHVVADGEDEAGGELPEGRARAGEGGGVGEEGFGGEQGVILARQGIRVGCPAGFNGGDVRGDAPEHFLNGLGGVAVGSAAHVALDQHLSGVVGQLHEGEVSRHAAEVEQ